MFRIVRKLLIEIKFQKLFLKTKWKIKKMFHIIQKYNSNKIYQNKPHKNQIFNLTQVLN